MSKGQGFGLYFIVFKDFSKIINHYTSWEFFVLESGSSIIIHLGVLTTTTISSFNISQPFPKYDFEQKY